MYLISHRGNINGRNPNFENKPDRVLHAIYLGFDVEVDVWLIDGEFWLGHDEDSLIKVKLDFLKHPKLWCHAKNIDALDKMLEEKIHCFWHQEDDVTITSKGFMWTKPGEKITPRSILLMPEDMGMWYNIPKCAGICSDRIYDYASIINSGL